MGVVGENYVNCTEFQASVIVMNENYHKLIKF